MDTFFNQLKDKHESASSAYREYMLGKTLLANSYVAENATEFVKDSFEIKAIFTEFANSLIHSDSPVSLDSFFDISLVKLYKNFNANLDFIGISRDFFIDLMTYYPTNLLDTSKQITWESLEKIIIAENNNEPLLTDDNINTQIKQISNNYALESITLGKYSCTKESLINMEESFNQLSIVVDCDKKQIGSDQFNFFYDNEIYDVGGYSTQYNNIQKIYLKSKRSYDAFAHEWLHGVDNLIATKNNISESLASNDKNDNSSSIFKLISKMKEHNPYSTELIKEYTPEKTLQILNQIVDRYTKLGVLVRQDELKQLLKEQINNIVDNNWNIPVFKMEMVKFCPNRETNNHVSFLTAEMELLNDLLNKKTIDTNLFMEYAKKVDINLIKNERLKEGQTYSTDNHELFARSFETFVDVQLKEKNIINVISKPEDNSYSPNKIELQHYLKEWKDVMDEIKNTLNDIYPIEEPKISSKIIELRNKYNPEKKLETTPTI